MRTGYQYAPNTWTVSHVTCMHVDIYINIQWFIAGGSLDRYGAVPEEVLGRIAVAVSGHFY